MNKGFLHIVFFERIKWLFLWALPLIILSSCYEETPIPVEAKFTSQFVNGDESVPVQVAIQNLTENADNYFWTFEGGVPATSTDKNPGSITFNQPGTYTLHLLATNSDGEEDTFEKEITVYDAIAIDFETQILESNFPPMEVQITNHTTGEGLQYQWTFEGGNPSSSDQQFPPNVVFDQPGVHTIALTVNNGFETETVETTVEVAPDIESHFTWEVDFFDDDFQAPVTLQCTNHSISETSYLWTFEGGTPATSTLENPSVTFHNPGTHTIQLTVNNGKNTATSSDQITVIADTNLRSFSNVKFGINVAHNQQLIPAFFSTELRQSFFSNEITASNGDSIDICFSGLNNSFNLNKFIAPNQVQLNGFMQIPNATETVFINSQEICNCGGMTSSQFDAMSNDLPLQNINITNSVAAAQSFDATMVPRVVLFQTQDGRKGAIKIKQFVDAGNGSYLLTDIKVQKLP